MRDSRMLATQSKIKTPAHQPQNMFYYHEKDPSPSKTTTENKQTNKNVHKYLLSFLLYHVPSTKLNTSNKKQNKTTTDDEVMHTTYKL